LVGLESLGIDSSPVAAAIAESKLVTASVADVVAEAKRILSGPAPMDIPGDEFWSLAYHPAVLESLCRFRESFLVDCSSPERVALRGVLLGALHGPQQKTFPSYFSNQCPRTFAPKPAYAVKFWRGHSLVPQLVDPISLVQRRASRYYSDLPFARGRVRLADSRQPGAFRAEESGQPFDWVITSPPYYGMRTYIPDQWLRNWFLGGPPTTDYSVKHQVVHSSPEDFAEDLRKVWRNAAESSSEGATMVIRFGGIPDRCVDPRSLIKKSLTGTGWRVVAVRAAGTATEGKRQADSFLRTRTRPVVEYDVWATKSALGDVRRTKLRATGRSIDLR
jgi:hypothetical protein